MAKEQVKEPRAGVDSPQPAGETQVSKGAARGYSWPTATEGNVIALKHGARSERAIAVMAAEVHETLLEIAPWCDKPHYLPTVNRYLQATAREQLMHNYVIKVEAEKGIAAVPSRLHEQLTAATNLAHKIATELGLNPLGERRLRATAANAAVSEITLADLMQRGEEAIASREENTQAALPQGTEDNS